ncbi:ANTAR domain-containing protein [Streptomyces sp. NBC_00626]|uniref:ANTAR domain-containing protein n=1 Tax=unclassified Streptomyces TaxID=2593676 RepID=UPI002E2571F3
MLPADSSGGDPSWAETELLAENRKLKDENLQLHLAMLSRSVIDQAHGMLMAWGPCTQAHAWVLLVEISQHCNVKLRDVAAALAATAEGHPLPDDIQHEAGRVLTVVQRASSGHRPIAWAPHQRRDER